jgi:hypothetical protein
MKNENSQDCLARLSYLEVLILDLVLIAEGQKVGCCLKKWTTILGL